MTSSLSHICIVRWNALHAGGPLPSLTSPASLVCGWLVSRVCEALWYWVVKELGLVFSLSNDIELIVASRYKQVGAVKSY